MSVGWGRSRFEMLSTSGRNACEFEVDQGTTGPTLRVRYHWATFGPNFDQVPHDVVLPVVRTSRTALADLLEAARRYGRTIGQTQPPPDIVAADLASTPGDRLRLEIRHGDPELITASWQAVFILHLTDGLHFECNAKHVIDATCLDVFTEALAAYLRSVPE